MKNLKNILFVSGIDTDIGKTIVTAYLAKWLLANTSLKVGTFKMVQTGNEGISEDIKVHRKICKEELSLLDKKGKSCAYLFKYPASPHLAAKLEEKTIFSSVIARKLVSYSQNFDIVLCEGAGGLQVPLHELYTNLDFIKEYNLPVVLVTSSRLGSINHTFLSLEALIRRGIEIKSLIYNVYPEPESHDDYIYQDSLKVLGSYLDKNQIECELVEFKNRCFSENINNLVF